MTPDQMKEEAKKKELADLKIKVVFSSILSVFIVLGSFPEWFSIFMLAIRPTAPGYSGSILGRVGILSGNMVGLKKPCSEHGYAYRHRYERGIRILLLLNVLTQKPTLYFDTAAVIITLILLGRFLEAKAKAHTSDAIKKLLHLQAKTARVIRDGKEIDVPIEEVNVDDTIRVRPGKNPRRRKNHRWIFKY